MHYSIRNASCMSDATRRTCVPTKHVIQASFKVSCTVMQSILTLEVSFMTRLVVYVVCPECRTTSS
jgi:hypothetical protein